MKSFSFTVPVLCVLLITLTACVTETTGRVLNEENPEEAADLNVQLGIGYLRQGDWQSARVKLEKATEQDPENAVAHRALGLVYENLDDIDGAERHYRRAVSLTPNDPDALNSLAVFLCKDASRREEALKIFDQALSIPLSETYSNKAMIYTNAGVCMKGLDLAKAEDYMRAALAVDPQYSDALLQLADVAYRRGNFLQSRAFLERHMSVSAPSPGALWLGVRVENAMNNFRAADQYGNQLRVSFPESVETRQLLEQLRETG
jgi:type IV pilus assembly protein PilF